MTLISHSNYIPFLLLFYLHLLFLHSFPTRRSSDLFEPTLKLLQHLRKLFCIVAVAFINVVKQWQVFIGRAEQRIADLPKIGPPLLVLAPFGQLALKIESVDEGVEVGAVIT